MNRNYLYHHGVKGMKWGIRRYQNQDGSLTAAGKKKAAKKERKTAKKEVNKLAKYVSRSGDAGLLISTATLSKFKPENYEKASQLLNRGNLTVKSKIKKNYDDKSLDVYVYGEKTPTIRARLKNGEDFTFEFLNKADADNYNNFVDYFNKRNSF